MAEANQFGLSSLNQLDTGVGWYSFSGLVTASTNAKPVILINNTGQRDSMITLTFGGAVVTGGDLNAGTASNVEVILGGLTIYQNKLQSIDMGNPFNFDVSLFIPRNSTLRIDVTDSDTTGKHTTMIRGYYV
tara:strand:- start:72 stop:467 length:396 start_codon:yes stop_codon:yes gene_type:complete